MKRFALPVIVLLLFTTCVNELAKKKIKKDSYKGVIIRIYQDLPNHNMYTFAIRTKFGETGDIAESWPYSWEYASVGDSIIKPPDTLMIIIKKPDGKSKEFFYR